MPWLAIKRPKIQDDPATLPFREGGRTLSLCVTVGAKGVDSKLSCARRFVVSCHSLPDHGSRPADRTEAWDHLHTDMSPLVCRIASRRKDADRMYIGADTHKQQHILV